MNQQKTDYNDLARAEKYDEITQDICQALQQLDQKRKEALPLPDHLPDRPPDHPGEKGPRKKIDVDRELLG